MRKSILYTFGIMIVLLFLWWLSGGNLINIVRHPTPIEVGTAFIWENFQAGVATIFNFISENLPF